MSTSDEKHKPNPTPDFLFEPSVFYRQPSVLFEHNSVSLMIYEIFRLLSQMINNLWLLLFVYYLYIETVILDGFNHV